VPVATNELGRRIAVAEEIMRRLESGERLSHVLDQAKLLMNMAGETVQEALMDILIRGLTESTYQTKIFADPVYNTAGKKYAELCVYEDVASLKLSVSGMENLRQTPPRHRRMSEEATGQTILNQEYYEKVKSALDALRSYVYIKASHIWNDSLKKKEKGAL